MVKAAGVEPEQRQINTGRRALTDAWCWMKCFMVKITVVTAKPK
jgi:hypothetical protein